MKKIIISVFIWIILFASSILIWRLGLTYDDFVGMGLFGLFLIALVSSATLFVPGPSLLAVFLAGATFNPVFVGLVMGLGAGLGELTGYIAGSRLQDFSATEYLNSKTLKIVARILGHNIMKFVSDIITRIPEWMRRNGTFTVFIIAAVPNIFIDVAGLVAGATRFSVLKFILACIGGKMIRFWIGAFLGYWGFEIIQSFLN